jgi:hypothetical protein
MQTLTDKQMIHRQYLQSQVRKDKRSEALAHYGCKCSRCGEHGADVHHRTYSRVGGFERMEDLEIMCRSCHEAHHAAERCMRQKHSRKKPINRRAIYSLLTWKQRAILKAKGGMNDAALSFHLAQQVNSATQREAARMIGATSLYGGFVDKPIKPKPGPTERELLSDELIALGFERTQCWRLQAKVARERLSMVRKSALYKMINLQRSEIQPQHGPFLPT